MAQRIKISDVNIERIDSLVSPADVIGDFPLSKDMVNNVLIGREQIAKVINGEDKRLLLIVGPCSIHDESAGLEYAERLLKLSQKLNDQLMIVMRVYFEKPRTTLGWKGLIYDPALDGSFDIENGLRRARGFLSHLAQIGLPAATEFLDPVVPQYLADLVSWAAIGARTIESQTHRQMACGLPGSFLEVPGRSRGRVRRPLPPCQTRPPGSAGSFPIDGPRCRRRPRPSRARHED